MGIPIILPLGDDHSEHLSHGMINALDAAVAVRMIGTRRNFARAEEFVNSVRQLEHNWRPLSERRLTGHPQSGKYLLTRMSAVPSAVNSTAETAYMSARRLKRSVKRSM